MNEARRVVSISGGKDSTATMCLALERRDLCHFVFANTGNEHELTLQHVHEYLPDRLGIVIDTVQADFTDRIAGKRRYVEEKWPEKGVPSDIVERALAVLYPTGNPFLDLCLWKGRFPSRKAQFCTQELKRRPLDNYLLALLEAGHEVESWRGIRRDESPIRRFAKARESTPEGFDIVHPIVDWSAQETVDYVRMCSVDLNPLYSMGMGRVGCMPCINVNKDELMEIYRRFPEYLELKREWEAIVGEACKRGRATFFSGKAARSKRERPRWIYVQPTGEEPYWREPDEDVFNRFEIPAMIRWAQTSHGGRQQDMMRSEIPPPACASLYGLCE